MSARRNEAINRHVGIEKEWIIALVLAAIHASMVTLINKIIPNPYMDEIFHIRQTRKYCNGDYTWDPMITTPPLLYVLAMPLCGGYERYVNSLLLPLTFIGACRFRRMFSTIEEPVLFPALSVVLLPVLLHSSVLFYTDLLSLTLVLWAFSSRNKYLSALLFGISLLSRQTNIIWAGMYAGLALLQEVKKTYLIKSFIKGCFNLWPFILLAGGFLMFVLKNGGIVLGDAAAHQPQFHAAQLLYFCFFACFSASFCILEHIETILRSIFRWKTLILAPIIGLTLHFFSLTHPYLLADNRHVPFYLWRWTLSKPIHRLMLVPIYLLCMNTMSQLSHRISPFGRLLFVVSTIAVLLPAHLIEPRYFIIPYALWRLSAETKSTCFSLLEVVFQVCVFTSLFYLFLFKPFEWTHEPGELQRFMW